MSLMSSDRNYRRDMFADYIERAKVIARKTRQAQCVVTIDSGDDRVYRVIAENDVDDPEWLEFDPHIHAVIDPLGLEDEG